MRLPIPSGMNSTTLAILLLPSLMKIYRFGFKCYTDKVDVPSIKLEIPAGSRK
jgi:hypothetical protein